MSSFTNRLTIMAIPSSPKGWRRFLPPSMHPQKWEVLDGFRYAIGQLDALADVIEVPDGFRFDGASVPFLLRLFLPMAHPNYIQATALHDWMLEQGQHSRRYCDRVFCEALGVLGMPNIWRKAMYCGVRLGALRWHMRQWLRGDANAH
jgi:hypothetical protein